VTVDANVTPNDHGSFDKTVRKTTYEEARAEFDGGAEKARTHTTVTRNATDQAVSDQPSQNVTVDANVTPNDHGSFDKTVRKTTYEETEAKATGGSFLTRETRTVIENGEDGEPNETPERGTAWDVTAQPNDHGSFRVTKTRRDAVADAQSTTWQDVQDNGDTVTTWNCGVFVYRNQSSVPSAPSFESVQCSLSINEFGLYDVTYHCRTFVSKEASSHSSGGGRGGTESNCSMTVTKMYQKKDGKMYKRDWTVTYDMCWGGDAEWLAKQTKGCKNFPELGCITGMKGRVMHIYKSATPGSESEIGGSSGS
jgi:hypothetical protein